MYHYKLRIAACTVPDSIFEYLREVEPLPGFTHAFSKRNELTMCDLIYSDVYIYGGKITPVVADFLTKARNGTKSFIILIGDVNEISEQWLNLAEIVDGVWPVPKKPQLLAGHFKRALRGIKERCDKELLDSYLTSLIDHMPDMVWFKDLEGLHQRVNNRFCQVVGKPKEVVEGRDHCFIWDLDPEEYAKGEFVCMETERPVIEQAKGFVFDEKVKFGDKIHHLSTYKSPVFDRDGKVIGTVGYARDITDVLESKGELKLILEALPVPALLYDEKNRVTAANKRACEEFGYREEDFLGRVGLKHTSTVFPNTHISKITELKDHQVQYDFVREGGAHTRYFRGMLSRLYNGENILLGSLLLLTDFTAEHDEIEAKYQQSVTDELTGCNNRAFYRSYVDKLVLEQKQTVVALIDLDSLKSVNDNFGHPAGDEYIVTAARLLQSSFGGHATICRLGGDEFVLFASRIDEETAQARLDWVNTELRLLGLAFPASISYGVGQGKLTSFEAYRELVAQIDARLYNMKKQKHITPRKTKI